MLDEVAHLDERAVARGGVGVAGADGWLPPQLIRRAEDVGSAPLYVAGSPEPTGASASSGVSPSPQLAHRLLRTSVSSRQATWCSVVGERLQLRVERAWSAGRKGSGGGRGSRTAD